MLSVFGKVIVKSNYYNSKFITISINIMMYIQINERYSLLCVNIIFVYIYYVYYVSCIVISI